jgi:hypothetical protein
VVRDRGAHGKAFQWHVESRADVHRTMPGASAAPLRPFRIAG